MIFIVDKEPGYLEECPFYDYETELCHGGGMVDVSVSCNGRAARRMENWERGE